MGIILYKAFSHFTYMKANFKMVTIFTVAVIGVAISFIVVRGIHSYISDSASIFKVISIRGLINVYCFTIGYVYSPYSSIIRRTPTLEQQAQI